MQNLHKPMNKVTNHLCVLYKWFVALLTLTKYTFRCTIFEIKRGEKWKVCDGRDACQKQNHTHNKCMHLVYHWTLDRMAWRMNEIKSVTTHQCDSQGKYYGMHHIITFIALVSLSNPSIVFLSYDFTEIRWKSLPKKMNRNRQAIKQC